MIQRFLVSDYQATDCLASEINDDTLSKEAKQIVKPKLFMLH